MIIWVDDHLFEAGAHDVDRLAFLRGAAMRRHTMVISTDPQDARGARASPGFDRWKEGLPDRLRGEVELLRRRLDLVSANAIARGAERFLVSEHGRWSAVPGVWLTMEEAVRAVVLPTYVLVENAINDGAFLRRVMPPAWRERLDEWERTGLLRYENAGGITVMDTLVCHHADDDRARQSFGLPSKLWCLVHVIVYDHDGEVPEAPSRNSNSVKIACENAGLAERSHRLQRRDQEHYLPQEAMEAIVRKTLKGGDLERHLTDIGAHFNQADRERYHRRLPNADTFKNAFSKYENSIAWRDEWFESDGAWPEMTLLAERIAAAI